MPSFIVPEITVQLLLWKTLPAFFSTKKKPKNCFLEAYILINIGALEQSANHNILQIVDVCHDVEKDEK